jgi:2-dehydropantoate 2-reductase
MRIAVVGCGGVGGVLAACLTRAGHDVTPVTGNAAIAAALERQGYAVTDFDGTRWSVPVRRPPRVAPGDRPAGRGADEAAPFDVVVLATQSTTLAAALAELLPHLHERSTVICCQNGLPEEHAARIAGIERTVGCVVGWGASMIAPGDYRRTSRGGLQLGRPDPASPDPAPLAALLLAASEAKVVDDLAAVRWSKLAINCATSTLGAAGGDRLGALLRHRFIRRLALEIFGEVKDVAARAGVRPAPVGGTFALEEIAISDEERTLKLGSPRLLYKHALLFAVGMKYRRMRSSMLYALERGRPPEIDYLNGELVRRGQSLGVPTPINAALVSTVQAIARAEKRPSLETLRDVYERTVGRTALR